MPLFFRFAVLPMVGLLLLTAQAVAQTALPDRVDQAIAGGIDWTWTLLQPNGMFSGHDPHKHPDDYFYYGDWEVVSMTSLAYGGVKPEDAKIKPALKTLLELDLDRTYTVGFRMVALAEFYRHAEEATKPGLRAALKKDADWLISIQHDDGSWHYYGRTGSQWDFSNTQIAVLALSEAVACGVEIDPAVFQKALKLYLDKQRDDGGWNYGNPTKPTGTGPSYAAMTAAGTASVLLLRDLLNPGLGCPCKGGKSGGRRDAAVDESIERGVQWLADHLPPGSVTINKDQKSANFYQHYAVERVGIYSGLKYLGTHDWYREGAAEILDHLPYRGRGSDDRGDAMFALLFLIKGRGPILMNKLKYEGDWELHPRDLARLCEYVGTIKEQRVNWQVVHLGVPVEELHDSPVLYISAERAIKFTDEEKKKLREFTDTGGTIFLEASCGNTVATAFWPRFCQELWPEWELKNVERDHPLWTADIRMPRPVASLRGLSDGLRTFLFYSPADVSCKWQTQAVTREKDAFDFGNNLFAYATDRARLRSRAAGREVGAGAKYAAGKPALAGDRAALTVARLAHGGRWNLNVHYRPWSMLAADLKARTGLDLVERAAVEPGQDLPAEANLLYLTGRDALTMDDAARTRLKNYLAGGGFLLAEATLGDAAFDASFRDLLGGLKCTLKAIEATDPLLTGQMPGGAKGYAIGDVEYTFALRAERVGKPQPLLYRLELDGKLVGIYSPFDILYAQTGGKAFGSRGYAAADARALATNLILFAADRATPAK
jgi:hypothetical protein